MLLLLFQGSRVSRGLCEAMQTVQHTKHFADPSNWAGFVLIGSDVRLSNKVALMGQALCELLKTPEKCRDALRVTLHLVRHFKIIICWSQFREFIITELVGKVST